jgi:hypothetical protein
MLTKGDIWTVQRGEVPLFRRRAVLPVPDLHETGPGRQERLEPEHEQMDWD